MAKKTSAKVWFHAQGQRAAAIGAFKSVREAMLANRILRNGKPLAAEEQENGAAPRGLPHWALRSFANGFEGASA